MAKGNVERFLGINRNTPERTTEHKHNLHSR